MVSKVNVLEKKESGSEPSFSNEVILDQVQQILQYPLFKVSHVLSAFLTYIVRETISGRSENLKEYNIAVDVFKKPMDFNTSQSGLVRVNARRLRDALGEYYDKNSAENGCEIVIPKGSYIPVFKRFTFLSSLPVQLRSYRSRLPEEKIRIAVMPFRSHELVRSKLTMIDSVGQILSTELSRLPCFSVLSYYTTWQLQSGNVSLREMHSRYNMQFALTGRIELGPKRIYVFLQLVKVETEMLIWSDMLELENVQFSSPNVSQIIVSRIMNALQKSPDLFDMKHVERLRDGNTAVYKSIYQVSRS